MPLRDDTNMDDPPYHMVNQIIGKHIGPFTTYIDAALARTIGGNGWMIAPILGRAKFEDWLHNRHKKEK